MKTAILWTALGTVCLLLSASAAFGQRVRLPSDTSQGSVVTLAQAPASTAGTAGPDASTAAPSSAPSTFNSPSPGTSSAAGMAAPPNYGSAPAYGTPGAYGSNQPSAAYPGSSGGTAPAYNPPALAPSANLGGTITPAPGSWDPYASGGPGGGQCPPAIGAAPGACVPCMPLQASAEFPWHVFGEFLYLEPRNTDVAYAIPVNGTGTQNGPTGIANPGYTPAFRIGFTRDLYDNTSSLGASWTRFYSSDNDSITTTGANGVNSLVLAVPGTYKSASASYNIDYDLVDIDYRGVFISSNRYLVNFLLGARYARLEQDFGGTFTNPGTENVNTNITFTGGGIRAGLEGERYAARSGLMVYGRTAASFMAGKFDAHYSETSTLVGATPINSELVSDRVVPILELELGVGWVSPTGHFRISGGYLFNAWYNVMRTSDLVSAVQATSYNSSLNTITFDGLVLHAEARY